MGTGRISPIPDSEYQQHISDLAENMPAGATVLYYLQEKSLLTSYYRRFSTEHDSDPTGERILVQVLGAPSLGAVQRAWEGFVMALHFP